MWCRHYETAAAGCDAGFTVDASRVTFGRGVLAEVGERARALRIQRLAVFTDARIRAQPWFADVTRSLRAAGLDTAVFDAVAVEPTDASFEDAARFAAAGRFEGYLSVGGGSVMDTCKAANLIATYPTALRTYVNAPVGDARPVPGPIAPHIACPTTSGTGSEVTGFAICSWSALHAKTAIASPHLRPTEALVDPRVAMTQPREVVAASGMDVLCHAVESYTARPFSHRSVATPVIARPLSQGANPWSDVGCREALRLLAAYFVRAVVDADDTEAREQMMWAATLAGIAFGNAGVHVPHAMAYAIGGGVRTFRPAGYPDAPLVPHGMAVALAAPAVFRHTASTAPARHLEAAALLGADARDATTAESGELLAGRVIEVMRAIGTPNGISAVGYEATDIPSLVDGVVPQQRLLGNAPCEITKSTLAHLFERAQRYW
ncbi:MAG: iron-containing alcohol dehydrogenase [Deltaproteobacteria bacterium]|nr:iron-containing alcohol dehydrogenase [Deltaproteobacteria bacterium]